MRSSLLKIGQAMALLGTLAMAPAAMAQGAVFTDQQKQAIGEIVKDYLIKNPEVLTEVIAELEKRQSEAQQVAQARPADTGRDHLGRQRDPRQQPGELARGLRVVAPLFLVNVLLDGNHGAV